MATDTSAVYALREPKPVPLNQVDQELSRIWATQEDGLVKSRASTFNLVVFSSVATEGLENMIGAVAVQYPCRALAISDDPTLPPETVTSEVTAYCPLVAGGQPATVCCEYVVLKATGTALSELYATILPLLIPDLATYLWWQGPMDPEHRLFSNLRVLAERVIVDSGSEGAAADLQTLQQLLGEGTLGDLNWWRLLPWRELTAKAFDNAARLTTLGEISQVELEFVPPNQAAVLLYLGWLTSSLGWTFQEAGVDRAMFNGPQGPIEVIWYPTGTKGEPGSLTTVRLILSENRYVLIRSGVIADCVQLQLEEEGQCTFEQVRIVDASRLDELLAQELQTASETDPYYRSALTVAALL